MWDCSSRCWWEKRLVISWHSLLQSSQHSNTLTEKCWMLSVHSLCRQSMRWIFYAKTLNWHEPTESIISNGRFLVKFNCLLTTKCKCCYLLVETKSNWASFFLFPLCSLLTEVMSKEYSWKKMSMALTQRNATQFDEILIKINKSLGDELRKFHWFP